MKNDDKHKNSIPDSLDLIKYLKPMEAAKSKDQVWAELEKVIDNEPVKQQAVISKLFMRKWMVAAGFVLMLSFCALGFLRFYTNNVVCLPGEQLNTLLPDGSLVHLNSQTSLSFHSYWWKVKREVTLDGEAFFKVKKGEKFTVVSKKGETSVMGTSFNIFSRNNDYEVTCLTGKVKVLSLMSKNILIIAPNQSVILNNSGNLRANLNVNAASSTDWTKGKFVFTRVPLNRVLSEIARRYGTEIKNTENLNQLYTGSFMIKEEIEPILNLVCKPFDIEYKKLPSGEYIISNSN